MKEIGMGKAKKGQWVLLILIAVTVVLVLVGCASGPVTLTPSPIKPIEGKLDGISEAPISKEHVTVGIYITNLYELSTAANTFYLSGYMWLRWKGDGDPLATLEFTNAVPGPFVRQPLYDEPVILSSGEKYQIIRLQGRFYDQYDLSNYPLDRQALAVFVENTTDSIDLVTYQPDTQASGFDSAMSIPGWNIMSLRTEQFIHDYGTDFGMLADASASKYATLLFEVTADRNHNQFYWKFLFPLLIVLATCWLCLVISPDMVGLRTGMPVSVLLTMVFLHLGTKSEIPTGTSLVLADKIYMLSYVMILATLGQIIWVNGHIDAEGKSNLAEMKKVDRTGLAVQVMVFAIGLVYMVMSALQ